MAFAPLEPPSAIVATAPPSLSLGAAPVEVVPFPDDPPDPDAPLLLVAPLDVPFPDDPPLLPEPIVVPLDGPPTPRPPRRRESLVSVVHATAARRAATRAPAGRNRFTPDR